MEGHGLVEHKEFPFSFPAVIEVHGLREGEMGEVGPKSNHKAQGKKDPRQNIKAIEFHQKNRIQITINYLSLTPISTKAGIKNLQPKQTRSNASIVSGSM